MNRGGFVFPLLLGKTVDAPAFRRVLSTARPADCARPDRRIGITKEH